MAENTQTIETEIRQIPPLTRIINLVSRFIKRQAKVNQIRLILTIIVVVAASIFLYKALIELMPKKEMAGVASSLIALATVFYGTIGFGLLNPYFSTKANIGFCKDTKDELEEFAKEDNSANHKDFLASFYELLKTLLK